MLEDSKRYVIDDTVENDNDKADTMENDDAKAYDIK